MCVRVCVCVCVCVCERERESEHNEYVDVYNFSLIRHFVCTHVNMFILHRLPVSDYLHNSGVIYRDVKVRGHLNG